MKIIKKIIKFFVILLGVFILGNLGMYIYCLITPKVEINKSTSLYFYDNQNNEILNDNNWVSLENISPYLIDATISTEDKHFYNHFGFDFIRIGKAIITNIVNRKMSEGASTITQQYARNLFLNFEKTWDRKIDEAIMAFELETHFTKDEILEGYLNTINYGGVFGIENASEYYFDKSASELTLAEASMLAGIPQSPSNLSPISNPENAKERQKIVLTLMENNNKITAKEKEEALNTELEYYGKSNKTDYEYINYFIDAVKDELYSIKSIPSSLIDTGGLKIYTTLDGEAQKDLEMAVSNNMNKDLSLEVAGIMMDPTTGGVMALVGGVDYNKSQFNRATKATRQVGSTMKPFLYYAALESGFTSSSTFTSEKTTFTFSNTSTYTPKNYNDTYAEGPISMGAAIAYSDNIYAVKTNLFLGEETLVNMANRVGIQSELDPLPSLALGTEEISLIDMVAGYSSFANLGNKVDSHFITKIEDMEGNILYEYKNNSTNILNSSITYILNEMLTYTYNSSFIDYNYPTLISLLPQITNKYAIKSGTTNTDLWIIGYNEKAVLGIWNGYDDNRNLTSNDNGFHKEIWIETMEAYFKNNETNWYDKPDNVVGVLVNPITGKLPTSNEEKTTIYYYIKGTEPYNQEPNDLETTFKEDLQE